jgi:hypothetical protein
VLTLGVISIVSLIGGSNDLFDLSDHALSIFLEACKELLKLICLAAFQCSLAIPLVFFDRLVCIFRDFLQCHHDDVLLIDLRAHCRRRSIQL